VSDLKSGVPDHISGCFGFIMPPRMQLQQQRQRAVIQRAIIVSPSDWYVRSVEMSMAPFVVPSYLTPLSERAESFPTVLKRKTPVVMMAARLTQPRRQRQQEEIARAWNW